MWSQLRSLHARARKMVEFSSACTLHAIMKKVNNEVKCNNEKSQTISGLLRKRDDFIQKTFDDKRCLKQNLKNISITHPDNLFNLLVISPSISSPNIRRTSRQVANCLHMNNHFMRLLTIQLRIFGLPFWLSLSKRRKRNIESIIILSRVLQHTTQLTCLTLRDEA